MKSILRLFLVLTLVFTGCEDTKKASAEKVAEVPEEEIGTEETMAIEEYDSIVGETPETPVYPKLTENNVVEFLTEYGRNNPETRARISTQHGDIEIQLFEDTPLHRANFVYLTKRKYFDGNFIHRIVPNFIIQGGNSDNRETAIKRSEIGKEYLLPSEIVPGRRHKYGTVSGAKQYRANPDHRTMPFEFFIFLGPQSATGHLNGSYTIFARVTKGMDVVEKIANLPQDEGEWPQQNVYLEVVVLE